MMEATQKLRFLNEYGELETIEPGDRAKAFEKSAVKLSGVGG